MTNDRRTVPAALDRLAQRLPDHDALITDDRSFTAADLRDEVHRAAAALISLGVRAGDRVAIWSPNTWHETGAGTWDEFIARGSESDAADAVVARASAVAPDDVSDILFTSGTTGRSKGVLCAHRQSLSASASWAANGKIISDDRYLCINPFFHNFGYKAGILACLQTGATLIPHLTFDPLRALQAIERHRITVLFGPPTIYQTLLDHPARGDYDLSSLRFAVTGAATVLVERMQSELDIDIVLTAYGLTEANGMGTMCRADDDAVTVATTCGRPFADFELRIDGATPGESGEVLLRGPNVMLGYLDDPEATAAAIDTDGWLHTGDIGQVDKAGNLCITDRLKDMYICGGFNVYPAEVEQDALPRNSGGKVVKPQLREWT